MIQAGYGGIKNKSDRKVWMIQMIKVAIVDDEQPVRDMLAEYLKRYAMEYELEIKIFSFGNGDELVADYQKLYDLIIFDIDMPGISGMEAARRVRAADPDVTILFMTNFAQYALDGYEVEAVDYILKPIGYPEFSLKLHKILKRMRKRELYFIKIETERGTVKFNVEEIYYVEVQNHNLIYRTASGEYITRGNMNLLAEELTPCGFYRIHRSFLVNLLHVKEVRNQELKVNEDVLPLGRNYKGRFMKEYLNFYGG